jgi:hypothetical protein
MQSFRTRTFLVTAEGSENRAAQVAVWLLERSARVCVRDAGLRGRIITRLKKRAPDGSSFTKMAARVVAAAVGAEPALERVLFAASYRGPLLIASNAAIARWAHYLAERSIWCKSDDSPLMYAERQSVNALVLNDNPALFERGARHIHVAERGGDVQIDHARGSWSAATNIAIDDGWLVANTERTPDRIVPLGAIRHYIDRIPEIAGAVLAAHALGVSYKRIGELLKDLPALEHDRQVVADTPRLRVIDDGASDAPDRGAASVRALGGPTTVLIAGGHGSGDWSGWAEAVRAAIRPTNLILLDGTATLAMRRALGLWGRGIRSYASIESARVAAVARAAKYVTATILYSPAAAYEQGAFSLSASPRVRRRQRD